MQNLEADRKRGEILRRDEQLESIKQNIARVEREAVDSSLLHTSASPRST